MSIWEALKKWAGADGTFDSVGKGLGNLKESYNEFVDTLDVMKNSEDEIYKGDFYGDGFGKHNDRLDRDKIYHDDYGNELYFDGHDWRKRKKG